MTNDFSIPFPPPELADQWCEEWCSSCEQTPVDQHRYVATQAARWGADQELEACCEWLYRSLPGYDKSYADYLRTARRPQPPSLKEQALDSWDRLRNEAWCQEIDLDLDTIRRALEQLDD